MKRLLQIIIISAFVLTTIACNDHDKKVSSEMNEVVDSVKATYSIADSSLITQDGIQYQKTDQNIHPKDTPPVVPVSNTGAGN